MKLDAFTKAQNLKKVLTNLYGDRLHNENDLGAIGEAMLQEALQDEPDQVSLKELQGSAQNDSGRIVSVGLLTMVFVDESGEASVYAAIYQGGWISIYLPDDPDLPPWLADYHASKQ